MTNPKKCSLAGNKSDPISFSNWEALAPFKTKSNILIERPGDLRFWCSISAERFDPKCPLSMAKIREHTVEDSEKESTFSNSVTRFLHVVKILHCDLSFASKRDK